MAQHRIRQACLALAVSFGLAACSGSPRIVTPTPIPTAEFPEAPFPAWTDADADYRFFPGDELALTVFSAPELNTNLTVAPDGRIYLPMGGSVVAGDKTRTEVETAVEQALARELRRPDAAVAPRTFVSQKIFVGGEVTRAGVYDLAGEIDPLQAIMLGGGFLNSARRDQVVILRRGPEGRPYMRVVDLRAASTDPQAWANLPRLRRFDVVFVPRSRISEIGLFTQQYIREAIPITLGFNYTIDPNRR
jgi:protein involved in polysaccharide export with SLBB domain